MARTYRWMMSALCVIVASSAGADTVADWAEATTEIATEGPNTVRTMALAQNAVYEAVNAITGRYAHDRVDLGAAKGASVDVAIAAASHAILAHEAPLQAQKIEAVYAQAMAAIPNDAARALGVSIGEQAAKDVLGKHTDDIPPIEPYRPLTTPGVFVPPTFPLGYAVAQHHPWFMKSAAQFRAPPPPALTSALWARDYNEIKAVGSATSTVRTAEQTDIARFWATALPDVHLRLVRVVDELPGRDLTRNARLYAAVAAALNDGEIAILDTKYHYQFWRPITAIRNGDRDDNPNTERDADWTPLIATPIQPEYPCGNCAVAATVVTVMQADMGREPLPLLRTTSNTAPGVTREWTSAAALLKEIANGRVYDGVHFRSSTEVGNHMGEQVGKLVAAAYGLH
ncbi:MAG TPA: vanadium-dependent haloperoxidase [Steroidobacteraceae bacterium]